MHSLRVRAQRIEMYSRSRTYTVGASKVVHIRVPYDFTFPCAPTLSLHPGRSPDDASPSALHLRSVAVPCLQSGQAWGPGVSGAVPGP